jgi:ABC-2 type transport system ATP-binding protein
MKQKLALAQAFSDPVEILILDEPTSALDPSARAEVLALVCQARDVQKQTVIFSGHVLSEVEEVSDRVAIMSEGRLLHLEDMHERRALRMVLLRFAEGVPPVFPQDLELTVRERNGSTCLLEHRGRIGSLLSWLSRSPIEDVAIGTDDLRSLYEQYHRPKPADSESPSR